MMSTHLTKSVLTLPLGLILAFSAWATTPEPTSALAYQQTTNTRIVVEENFLRFFTGGSERMTIDADGNVGVGTTSPSANLHVSGSEGFLIERDNKTLHFNAHYGGHAHSAITTDLGMGFRIATNKNNSKNSPQFVINPNGNVGIGTSDPGAYMLNVNGNTFVNGSLTFPTVSHDGATSATLLSFPVATDGFYIMTEQKSADKMDVLFRFRDNTTGDYFKLWFDDYRGAAYDRYPLIVYGNGVHLVSDGGNVGIGTTSPSYKLHVNGDAKANRFISNTNTYADFVFKDDYRLAPLSEVELYIGENHHLPDIPSEAEAKENGVDLQKMQAKLLQKIEELTLYVIEQNKRIESQSKSLEIQQKEIEKLKTKQLSEPRLK